MHFSIIEKNKRIAKKHTLATSALALTIAFALLVSFLPAAGAHVPAWQVPTFAYITASPNPVGVNQIAYLIFWIDKPPPSAIGAEGDRWLNLKLDVIKPDGTQQPLGSYTSDPIGGGYATYVPDQTGTYTFKFSFPGQVASIKGPTGLVGSDSVFINDTFLPSSSTTTLTVQKDKISGADSYPLPTNYWTRPIEAQNTNWATIASNWLGSPQIVGKYQPDGSAPNSPHIMWTKPFSFGGVVGGSNTLNTGAGFYGGLSYEGKFTSPLIMYGRLYYNLPQSNNPSGNGYVCVDLTTGETIYWQNMTQPTFGQLYDYESPNQHGVIPNGYLWRSVSDARNGGTVWMAYDAIDGNWLFNLTNVPSGTTVYGSVGEVLIYQMNYASRWLALWNNTAAPGELLGTSGTNFWQWRPVGKNINASTAYSWNVTIPSLPGSSAPAIIRVFPGDLVIGRSTTFSGFSPAFGTPDPYTLWAINLNSAKGAVGSLLWIKNYSAPLGNTTMQVAVVSQEARTLALNERETMRYWGVNIDTGSVIWGPTKSESPLDYYQKLGANEVMTAYGRLYTSSYGGIARCYDLKNGNLMWTYNNTVAGYDSVWPNYPLGMGAIADDKVYLFTSEHSPNSPGFLGSRVRCVNATTGTELWTMLSWASGYQGAGAAFAAADGNLVYLNTYDMQIYCIGKGPSATTVTSSPKVSSQGSGILIEGTVTDQTPSAKGTPAVSDGNMGEWMEYIHMQKPLPNDAIGVNVHLTAIDPNGNAQDIGIVTSDKTGLFKKSWTPPVPGEYIITATFEGSNSYWPSTAETAMLVNTVASTSPSVPSTTTNPTTSPLSPTASPIVSPTPTSAPPPNEKAPIATYVGIAAAVLIVVAVAAVLVLRKRK